MKNVKFFLLSILSLFACQFNTTFADSIPLPNYEVRIANLDLAYKNAMLTGTIQINHGYVLRVVDYKERDDNVLLSWQSGDRLELTAHTKGNQLFLTLQNCEKNGKEEVVPYVIFDAIETTSPGLKIAEITNNGKNIKLSDNSVWEFSWFNQFSTKNWKVGNRLLVQKNGDSDQNSYYFINFDVAPAKNSFEAKGTFIAQ